MDARCSARRWLQDEEGLPPRRTRAGRHSVSFGRPSVSVPVLSTTTVSTFSSVSSTSAFLMSTPSFAPRPIPTMIDIGVARPRAHGQAIISTATALTKAHARAGCSGAAMAHTKNVRMAITTTAGTKYPATRSATFWIGARLRWASATMFTICESTVSWPTFSATIRKEPVWLTVPPITGSSFCFSTGIGSPVIIDSSTVLLPSVILPSTGIFSPGRTRRMSPWWTSSSGTSRSWPSRTIRAVGGASDSNSRMAVPVRRLARSSNTCPSRTKVTMTADASK